MESIEMTRINIRLATNVKDWYMLEANKMGMNMTQYIAFVLSNHFKTVVAQESLNQLALLSKDPEYIKKNQEFIDLMIREGNEKQHFLILDLVSLNGKI